MNAFCKSMFGQGRSLAFLAALVCCLIIPAWAQAPTRETFSAAAMSPMVAGARVLQMNIIIEGYSSDQEVMQLVETLRTGGNNGLLDAMTKMKSKGRLAPVMTVGADIKVVRSRPTEKGRIITVVTDRNPTFRELYGLSRSEDYPFTIAQLDLDATGNGEGILLVATKVVFNKDNHIELEQYGTQPVQLRNVRLQK